MIGFLGGVRDAAGTRGFVPVAGDRLVAVDLAGGARLWARERVGRPIAATADRVVTVDARSGRLALRVLDAANGADVGDPEIVAVDLPAGMRDGRAPEDAVQVEARETAGGMHVEWRVRHPYRGGAPPPAEVAAAARAEQSGAVRLDLATGAAHPVTATRRTAAPEVEASTDATVTSADPAVVALSRVGDRQFALRAGAAGGATAVTLEARDAGGRVVLWETTLLSRPAGPPRPPRP